MNPPTDHVVVDVGMRRVHERALFVAAGSINVLIVGETGTGKEIIAETIHYQSPRRGRPLLRLNCAALSESLATSELFGHEKGAFTGAGHTKCGLLEAANGGTVFLDEIGEMPVPLQAGLLRVIEDRRITPVGGLRPRPIDVRFVSATNRRLERAIDGGSFRRDFFYRLSGVTIAIPPLRARSSEIEPLARHFLTRAAHESGRRPVPSLAPEALRWMMAHPWPGNVRELRNAVERALLLCSGNVIRLADILEEYPGSGGALPVMKPLEPPRGLDTRDLGAVTGGARAAIADAMDRCGGNQTRAAKLLQISRGTLVSRLTEYGFPRPRKGL